MTREEEIRKEIEKLKKDEKHLKTSDNRKCEACIEISKLQAELKGITETKQSILKQVEDIIYKIDWTDFSKIINKRISQLKRGIK